MEGAELRVLNTAIWPGFSTKSVHEAAEAVSCCDAEKTDKVPY